MKAEDFYELKIGMSLYDKKTDKEKIIDHLADEELYQLIGFKDVSDLVPFGSIAEHYTLVRPKKIVKAYLYITEDWTNSKFFFTEKKGYAYDKTPIHGPKILEGWTKTNLYIEVKE